MLCIVLLVQHLLVKVVKTRWPPGIRALRGAHAAGHPLSGHRYGSSVVVSELECADPTANCHCVFDALVSTLLFLNVLHLELPGSLIWVL